MRDLNTDADFKELSFKQKLAYIWRHHRKHIIIFAFEILVILLLLFALTGKKGAALTGIALNSSDAVSTEMISKIKSDLFEGANLDSEQMDIDFLCGLKYYLNDKSKAEDNYELVQLFVSQTHDGNLDFLTGDLDTVTILAYSSFFQDLSNILTEEQMKLYKPYLRYVDQAVIDEIKQATADNVATDIQIPDCTKPEEMKKPIPVMIDMSQYDSLSAIYSEATKQIVFAVFENSPARSNLREVIKFIVEEKMSS